MHHVEQLGWTFEPSSTGVYRAKFSGDNGEYTVVIVFRHASDTVLFYVTSGEYISKKRRDDVVQFITMLNYNRDHVTYEIDLSDGALRARSSYDASGGAFSEAQVQAYVNRVVMDFDKVWPSLQQLSDERKARPDDLFQALPQP